jgi:pSer/pThr/pTyr-binding forkhead associated (FHA) protein
VTGERLFEKLAGLARHSVRRKFEEAQGGFFILGKVPEGEAGAYLGFSTGSYNIQALKEASQPGNEPSEVSGSPSHFVQRVRKKEGNDWVKWISVGRARNNDVVLRYSSVSKLHARVSIEESPGAVGQQFLLMDLDSAKGTVVNGTRLKPSEPHTLNSGDKVRFGEVECRFLDSCQLYDALRQIP